MEIEMNLQVLIKLLSKKTFASFKEYVKMQMEIEAIQQMSVVTPMKKNCPLQVVLFHKWGPDEYKYAKNGEEFGERYAPNGPSFFTTHSKDGLSVDEYHINTGYKGKQKLPGFAKNISKKANLIIFKK